MVELKIHSALLDNEHSSPVVFHTCKVRYDCVRKEYTSIFPPVNTTLFTTLGVLIRVSIELSVLLFDVEKRIQFRESVADKFNVPLSMVSLMNVSSIGGFAGNGVRDEVELLQAYVKIGTASQEALASSDACMLVDCNRYTYIFRIQISVLIFPTILEQDFLSFLHASSVLRKTNWCLQALAHSIIHFPVKKNARLVFSNSRAWKRQLVNYILNHNARQGNSF